MSLLYINVSFEEFFGVCGDNARDREKLTRCLYTLNNIFDKPNAVSDICHFEMQFLLVYTYQFL